MGKYYENLDTLIELIKKIEKKHEIIKTAKKKWDK